MRMYFDAALENLALDLTFCADVAEALATLAERPARLVITDLRLGRECGLALVERLRADPATFGAPRIVVTGAALDGPGIGERSRRLGVWRLLDKPVSLEAIEVCVVEALEDSPPPPSALPESGSARSMDAVRADPQACGAPPAATLDTLFGGDLPLYTAYRESCITQFRADVAQGDALAGADALPALSRLAHNLRSVLRLLGEEQAAVQAERLETLLDDTARAPQARPAWQRLRAALLDTIARA